MISIQNLTLTLRGKTLLRNINLDVQPGHFTAVAGPNGAGKTSLLKVLSREFTHYGGSVEINGVPVSFYSVADLANVRSVLSQETPVQFPFTVQQIMEMGRHHLKSTRMEHKAVCDEVAELTGISEWMHRSFLTLSGGEQQRVQLARVLAQVWARKGYPRYILLDEPTSNLDINQQQLIFSVVKSSCERNIGVFAIVHDLNQVAQFADKLYFLKEGNIVAGGNPKDVFTKPIIEETFCCRVNIYNDPCTDCPYVVPEKNTQISPLKRASL